ncbi:MAG: hypothetical protein HYW05_03320 [Candidatus Diapherotrites archaeon]|nr:hypothetical protein [Candidatus Diapherotrites archaeon]
MNGSENYNYNLAELNKLLPYMALNKDYSVKFDSVVAKAELPEKYVKLGKLYEEYHNNFIQAAKANGVYSNKIKELPDNQFFSNFFESKSTMTAQATISASSLVCGGSQQQPHQCPARVNSGISKKSQTEISNYLKGMGFHNTYWPGCGPQGYTCSTDFTKWISAYNCTWGSFRTQANIFQSGTKWTYRTQSPEPNPEIFSYSWPVYWWGTYVSWWHLSCN